MDLKNNSDRPIFPGGRPTLDGPRPDGPRLDDLPRPVSSPVAPAEVPPIRRTEPGKPIEPKKPKKLKFHFSFKKLLKNKKKAIIIAIAAVVVVVAAVFLVFHFTAPLHITKIETLRALSSRVENPPVQEKFIKTDPVMLHFEYADAKVGSVVNFEVKKSNGETVKSGSTTVLRETGDDKADGKRYISIVNTPSTALEVGQYRIILTMDGREVGAINFEISE